MDSCDALGSTEMGFVVDGDLVEVDRYFCVAVDSICRCNDPYFCDYDTLCHVALRAVLVLGSVLL
jgi:hypothetical protein